MVKKNYPGSIVKMKKKSTKHKFLYILIYLYIEIDYLSSAL